MVKLHEILEAVENLCNDRSISKNVHSVLEEIKILIAEENKDVDVKIDTALQRIENLSLDPNLSTYARTQIWNLTSILEAANHR